MPDRPVSGDTLPTALSLAEFTRRALVVAVIAVAAGALVAVIVLASDVLFLFFAATVLALLLRGTADEVAGRTGLSPGWAYGLVVLIGVGLFGGAGFLFGTAAVSQVNKLVEDLPELADQARARLSEYPGARELLDRLPPVRQLLGGASGATSTAATFFTTTFGILGSVLVLIISALYLGATPQAYVEEFLTLVPQRRRDRGRVVLSTLGRVLRMWLLGRLIAGIVVGVITALGLWLAGVPQFLVLGLVAGVLSAIPYIGSILGAVPGVIIALTDSPATAGWAIGVYMAAQLIENYLVTPLVEREAVNMPPVLAIASLTLFGSLSGALGLIVAAPLTVAIKVLVQMLYIEDVLGDDAGVET